MTKKKLPAQCTSRGTGPLCHQNRPRKYLSNRHFSLFIFIPQIGLAHRVCSSRRFFRHRKCSRVTLAEAAPPVRTTDALRPPFSPQGVNFHFVAETTLA